MFNVTIINAKDITKYFIILVLLSLGIYGVIKLVNSNSEEIKIFSKINEVISGISGSNFINCLNINMPQIRNNNIENEENVSSSNTTNLLEAMFSVELIKQTNTETANVEIASEESVNQENNNDENAVDTSEQEDEVSTEIVTQNPITVNVTNTYGAVQIKNETSYSITYEMLIPDIEVDSSNIVIFHTHTCESYTATEQYQYQATGTYRTTDLNYSVARVGEELSNYLLAKGYSVIHNKTYHDYPAYSGSYNRSLQTVESILQTINADIVIDLHRDAIGSNSNYAPTVKIGDEYAAQLMFVIGTDGGGLQHSNWNQNLKFAVKIQEKAEEMYPGLFKPIILRNSRYNQHVSKAATIIEVGATGNTLEQCLTSMKFLSEIIDEALK